MKAALERAVRLSLRTVREDGGGILPEQKLLQQPRAGPLRAAPRAGDGWKESWVAKRESCLLEPTPLLTSSDTPPSRVQDRGR